jgi:phospholipid transport system substrate-binding protein
MKAKWIHPTATLALAVMMTLAYPSFAVAEGAKDQLKQTVDNVLGILTDPNLKGEAKSRERRQKLEEAIYARFDFAEMAKRSLGAEWRKRSPAEQEEFVKLFTSLLQAAYLDDLESYNGEKVRYLNDRQEKDYAQVNTKITNKKGEDFSVDYRLQNMNGDWKVVDVVIENISLVNNYRSQFNHVIAKSSYAELVRTMKQKKLSAPGAKS